MSCHSTLRFALLVWITARVASAGWFDGTPPESQAEAFWRNQFSKSGGLLQVTSFKKTDGKGVTTPVGNAYVLYYTLTFDITDDCQYDGNYNARRGLTQGGALQQFADSFDYAQGHKGQKMFQTGEMDYEKRESGWVLVNTNKRIYENPTDVQRRAEEAARKKAEEERIASEKQAHLDALTARAKERHNTILEKPLRDYTNEQSINGKIVLSDCDLTSYDSNGTYTIWFVDIKGVQQTGNWLTIVQKDSRQVTFKFVSPADVNAFCNAFRQSLKAWWRENTELLGPVP